MIVFLTTGSHQYTHKDVVEAARGRIDVGVMTYDRLFEKKPIKTATYIFTDLDRLSGPDLSSAATAYRKLNDASLRALNDPAKFCSRFGLLRLLFREGLNDFNAYRVEEKCTPEKWPVFIRCASGHGAVSPLLANSKELDTEIANWISRGFPRSDLLITEYAGEEVQPGLYRKLSTFQIGSKSVAFNNVHQDVWAVKGGVKGIATPELYRDELRIVRDNPYGETLLKIFHLSCIEYGRIDYGFLNGRIQIFEINTNPEIHFPTEHPVADRIETYRVFKENYLNALQSIDRPSGDAIVQ